MWSDKCEWMHGFTKFGAWYPNQIFRSESVGKRKTINTCYIHILRLMICIITILHPCMTTEILILTPSNLNEDLKAENEDFWWSVSYIWWFTLSSPLGTYYVSLRYTHGELNNDCKLLLPLVITIQNTKNTNIHSGNLFCNLNIHKPTKSHTESLIMKLIKLFISRNRSVWVRRYK